MRQGWLGPFRFEDPFWLLLLLPLAAALIWHLRTRRSTTVVFSSVSVFRDGTPTWRVRLMGLVPVLFGLGLAALTIALARPQYGQEDYRVRSDGIAMAICLDRSGSMQAMDFFLNNQRTDRFTVVKKIFHDFVLGDKTFTGRPDDRVALLAFGGYVDALCPLTLDHEALAEMLGMIEIPQPLFDSNGRPIQNSILDEESATAIGDALVSAVERLEGSKAKSNVVILLSDGKENTGAVSADEAAKLAKSRGVRVYTLGIGSTGVAPFPVTGPGGQKVYMNQPVELDEAALERIASVTGGKYFNARDADTLRKVCAEIDTLEKTTHEERVFTKYRELYRGSLALGLVSILLAVVLDRTVFRTTPE